MYSRHHMSRRRFVQYAGLGFAAGSVFARTESAKVPVIDTHTHFYDPTRPQGVPWPPETDQLLYKPHLPEHFCSLTNKHGVVGTIVVEASSWLDDNQWILDLAKDNSIIVGYIGNLEPDKPEFSDHLERFGQNPIFRGLRLHGLTITRNLDNREFRKDLSRLADRELTLDVVGGAQMLPAIERLAKLMPDLRIVIDHLPFRNWNDDMNEIRRALTKIAEMPNVYAKISDVVRRIDERIIEKPEFYRPVLDVLWELFGPDRAMFGSNWPVSDRVAPYSSVIKVVADYFSTKKQSQVNKFFYANSQAAYQWKIRT